MRFAGNVIWFVLVGAIPALFWLLGAAVFAISIIGLPLTRAAIEMAKMTAAPFGRDVVHVRELDARELDVSTALTGTIGFVANIVWALTFGLTLFLYYLAAGVLCCLSLILIPFGLQCFKLAGLSLWPVGRRVVSRELAHAARTDRADRDLARYRGRREPDAPSPRVEPPAAATAAALPPPDRATRLPPQLATDRGWFVEVVGESNYQPALAAAARGGQRYEGSPLVIVTLEPEDDNPHDPDAVRVGSAHGTLGYLPRAAARQYRNAIGARRATCSGLIHGLDEQVEDDDGEPTGRAKSLGIWLNAAWPPHYK